MYWITVNYNSTSLIEKLINSIPLQANGLDRVIIINNSPHDRSIHKLQSESILILDSPENIGFGRACNLGLNWVYQQDKNAIVWLINPDATLPQNAGIVDKFFEAYPDISILGTVVEEPCGKIEFGAGEFNLKTGLIRVKNTLPDISSSEFSYIPMIWVSGCSLLINFKNFTDCPQFDSDYFLYYEDFDLCLRYSKQGHKIGLTPDIRVQHQPSSITSRNQELKIQQSIYSYLLSLEKHTNRFILCYRFLRILSVSCLSGFSSPDIAKAKLQGVWLYFSRIISSAAAS